MKSTFYTAVISILLMLPITGIYQISFTTIDGEIRQMSGYQGKKLLIITLPCSQSASGDSLLFSLDTLASNNSQTLKVLAVPAKEDGFNTSNKAALLAWYRSKLGNYVTIMDGVNTRRNAGGNQNEIFSWLTRVDKNENFDIDADAPGFKFFITETGNLYSVLRPTSKVWGMSVQRALHL